MWVGPTSMYTLHVIVYVLFAYTKGSNIPKSSMEPVFEPEINFWLSKKTIRLDTFKNIRYLPNETKKNLAEYGFCYGGKIFGTIHCFCCLRVVNEIPSHNYWCTFYFNPAHCRKIKSYIDFYYERERLSTFVDWPLVKISPYELAKNGFYYSKILDRCVCFECRVTLEDWEITDNVEEEHRKHCESHCNMVQKNKGVFLNVTLQQSNILDRALPFYEEWPLYHSRGSRPEETFEFFSDAPRMTRLLKEDYHARKFSFEKNWPYNYCSNLSGKKMAMAGFFYTQFGDIVQCISCQGFLSNWKLDDNIWEEHARWYSNCRFVNLHKDEEFIDNIIKNKPPKLKFFSAGDVRRVYPSAGHYNINKLKNEDISEFMSGEVEDVKHSTPLLRYFKNILYMCLVDYHKFYIPRCQLSKTYPYYTSCNMIHNNCPIHKNIEVEQSEDSGFDYEDDDYEDEEDDDEILGEEEYETSTEGEELMSLGEDEDDYE